MLVGVGEKGTFPARVTALGQAGHGSTPSIGDNAVPHLGELLRRVGQGMPEAQRSDLTDRMLDVLLAEPWTDATMALRQASRLHPMLEHMLPAVVGTTMAPTMLTASFKRNVMPARAVVELDCRILPGTTEADVEREVRARLGDDVRYELDWPEPLIEGSSSPAHGTVMSAITSYLAEVDPDVLLLPVLDTGFTDSVYLRAAARHRGVRLQPDVAHPRLRGRRRLSQRRRARARRRPAGLRGVPPRPRPPRPGSTVIEPVDRVVETVETRCPFTHRAAARVPRRPRGSAAGTRARRVVCGAASQHLVVALARVAGRARRHHVVEGVATTPEMARRSRAGAAGR